MPVEHTQWLWPAGAIPSNGTRGLCEEARATWYRETVETAAGARRRMTPPLLSVTCQIGIGDKARLTALPIILTNRVIEINISRPISLSYA